MVAPFSSVSVPPKVNRFSTRAVRAADGDVRVVGAHEALDVALDEGHAIGDQDEVGLVCRTDRHVPLDGDDDAVSPRSPSASLRSSDPGPLPASAPISSTVMASSNARSTFRSMSPRSSRIGARSVPVAVEPRSKPADPHSEVGLARLRAGRVGVNAPHPPSMAVLGPGPRLTGQGPVVCHER